MYIVNGVAHAGTPQQGLKVERAKVVEDLVMLATFSSGETRLFDASPLITMPAFTPLENRAVFEDFFIDHGVVCWCGGDIDIAPETMYKMSYEYNTAA